MRPVTLLAACLSLLIAASAVSAAILDDVPGAAAAYSLRLLDQDYAGPAINVKRTSDGATQDIGFVNGRLDTASLLSFIGSSNGLVTTWYDQSGNGRDASDPDDGDRPNIVTAGGLDLATSNKLPALRFDGSDALTLFEGLLSDVSVSSVQEFSTAPSSSNSLAMRFWNFAFDNSTRFSIGVEGGGDFAIARSGGSFLTAESGTTLGTDETIFATALVNFSSSPDSYDIFVNGNQEFDVNNITNLTDANRFVIGGQDTGGTRGLNGYSQEVILYSRVLGTDEWTAIYNNQVSFYTPEPTTLAIWSLLAGLGVALGWRRRRA